MKWTPSVRVLEKQLCDIGSFQAIWSLEPHTAISLPSQQQSEGTARFTHVTFCCLLLFQCASALLCWRMECWHTTCRNRRVSTEIVCHVTAVHYPFLSCVSCIPVCLCFVFTQPSVTHSKSSSHVAHLLLWKRDHERKKIQRLNML